VYENEEFNLLQHALNIEDSVDDLRYNKVVLATDADVDGMHIRLLMITFFLQFFPDLIREGHLYILETPLFRVRNKQETRYCYTEEERQRALAEVKNPEITRFKGLGEMNAEELRDTTLDPANRTLLRVTMTDAAAADDLFRVLMGEKVEPRRDFIERHALDVKHLDV
jgi:topoisomerase-4 subunit B